MRIAHAHVGPAHINTSVRTRACPVLLSSGEPLRRCPRAALEYNDGNAFESSDTAMVSIMESYTFHGIAGHERPGFAAADSVVYGTLPAGPISGLACRALAALSLRPRLRAWCPPQVRPLHALSCISAVDGHAVTGGTVRAAGRALISVSDKTGLTELAEVRVES